MNNTPADTIVQESIDVVQERSDGKAVSVFTTEVQEEVRERTEVLQEQVGSAAKDIAGEVMEKAKSYKQSRDVLFEPDFTVKSAVGDAGAAGWNDKGNGNEIALAEDAMAYEIDTSYWQRVGEHERVHRDDQSGTYNRTDVTYVDETGSVETVDVVGTMTEWQATQKNIASDLTPEYTTFKEEGQEFADAVGEGRVVAALKTGDIQGLQDEIIEEHGAGRRSRG